MHTTVSTRKAGVGGFESGILRSSELDQLGAGVVQNVHKESDLGWILVI